MRFSGINAVFLVAIALGSIGCGDVHSQKYSLQNQWLATNYPDRASHLNQLGTAQPYFREDVIAGQVQLGMTLDEVLIATDTTPFGPKRYKGKFWCDTFSVERCDAGCRSCEGLIFVNHTVVWFRGHNQLPTVIDVDERSHQDSIFASPSSEKFRIAEALYRNDIILGMSMNAVERILGESKQLAAFYCEDARTPMPPTCDATCNLCKIELSPPISASRTQVIFLRPVSGELRVFRIENEFGQVIAR